MDMNIVVKQEPEFDETRDNGFTVVHAEEDKSICKAEDDIMYDQESQTRFANISEDQIMAILTCKDNINTVRSTKAALTVLHEYCVKKEHPTDFVNYSKSALAYLLRQFYVEARRKDGQLYKRSALNAIRYGLNRYFQENLKLNFDIIKDSVFLEANRVFKAQMYELSLQGKGTTHNPQMTLADVKKIYKYFAANLENPQGLQEKVFFDIIYHLSRGKECGRENLREMRVSTFTISKDEQGRRFVHRAAHLEQGSLEELENKENRMHESIGNRMCAVKSFEMYLSKLSSNCDFLWQRPRDTKYISFIDCWYVSSPMGHNSLGSMTKSICRSSGVTQHYTNQSIRATPLYPLDMYCPVKIPVLAWSNVPISMFSGTQTPVQPPAQTINMQTVTSVVPQTLTAVVRSTPATSFRDQVAVPSPNNRIPKPPEAPAVKNENRFAKPAGDILKDYARCSWYPVSYKCSEFSKYDDIFPLKHRGKQGVAFNMICFVYNEMKYAGEWTSFDPNNLLFLADELFSLIRSDLEPYEYTIDDFPVFVEVFDSVFNISVGDKQYHRIDSNDLNQHFTETISQNKYVIVSLKEFTFSLIKCNRCPGLFICDAESKSFAVLSNDRREALQKSKVLHMPDIEGFICFLKLLDKCSLVFNETDGRFILNTVTVDPTTKTKLNKYKDIYSTNLELEKRMIACMNCNNITHPQNRIILRGDYLMADRGDGLNVLLGALFFHHMKPIHNWLPADLMAIESSVLSVINSWESSTSQSHWERLTTAQHFPKYLRLTTQYKEYRLSILPADVYDDTWLHEEQEFRDNVAFLYSFGAAVIKDNKEYGVILEQFEMWNTTVDLTVISVSSLEQVTSLLKWKAGMRNEGEQSIQIKGINGDKLFHVMEGTVLTQERNVKFPKDSPISTIPFTSKVMQLTEKR